MVLGEMLKEVEAYCIVYLLLSMLARGSDEGVIRLMTWRICCLSSPSSCTCWSSTEATNIKPGGE